MAASPINIYRNYTNTDTTVNVSYKENEALPSIETLGWEREGYIFLGYNTSKDGSGTSYAVGEVPWTLSSVYAQWQESNAFLNYDGLSYFYGKLKDTFAKPEDITIPTNVSAFTNDAGYLTSADIPEGASAYTGTISAVGTTASAGTNNGFARGDHVHNITKSTITSALGYTPYNSTNPNGYISSYTETDPVFAASPAHGITSANITAWNNKQNALTPGTGISISNNTISTTAEANVQSNWTETNTSSDAYIKNKPTKVSAFTNDAGYITSSSVAWGNISGTLEDQSDLLDELGEINASIAANGESISQLSDALADKQDILTAGNGISISNDTISADNTIARTSQIPTVPTNVSSFTNDAGYLTSYTETDPVFTASAAHGITSSNISSWNGKMNTPSGGTTGQVLTKTASGYGWANASSGSNENLYAWHSSTGSDQGTHLTYTKQSSFENLPSYANVLVTENNIEARNGTGTAIDINLTKKAFTIGSRISSATIGSYSYAQGYNIVASGLHSHAQNYNTIAAGDNQTAMGKYNIEDTTSALIIGNGSSLTPSNALTVDWNGNVNAAGAVNGTNTVFTDVRNTQRSLPDLATSIITGYRTTIYAASWSTDKVEYYGKYWYKYDLAFNDLNKNLITSVPIIGISGADEYTPPTSAEQEAYDTWEYAFADTYNNSINFISRVKPTSDFSVIILGVI